MGPEVAEQARDQRGRAATMIDDGDVRGVSFGGRRPSSDLAEVEAGGGHRLTHQLDHAHPLLRSFDDVELALDRLERMDDRYPLRRRREFPHRAAAERRGDEAD